MAPRSAIVDALSPLRPLYEAWMRLVRGFSWLLIRVLVGALFVTVFVAYGVGLRVTDSDPLDRDLDEPGSFWSEEVRSNDDMEDFRKLY